MEEFARIFKILSDQNRLRIIALLSHRKMCVCELAYVLGVTQPSISRHLRKMKAGGFIQDEQDGLWTNYFLSCEDRRVKMLLEHLKKWVKGEKLLVQDLKKLKKVDRAKLCC